MRGGLASLVIALGACGRIGFSPERAADRADAAADAPPTPSDDAAAPLAIAFAQVAQVSVPVAGAADDLAFPADVAAGDLLLFAVDFDFDGALPTIAARDTQANAYAVAVGPGTEAGYAQAIFVATAAASAPDTVTVELGAPPATFLELHLLAYRGATAVDTVSTAFGQLGSADAIVRGAPVQVARAGEVIVGYLVGHDGEATVGTESELRSDLDGDIVEDRTAPAAGTYAETVDAAAHSLWTFLTITLR